MRIPSEHTPDDLMKLVVERFRRLGSARSSEDSIQWWSWPEVFPSTSGPGGGIGGQAMTTFQVFGFRCDHHRDGLLYCGGHWRLWRRAEQRWQR